MDDDVGAASGAKFSSLEGISCPFNFLAGAPGKETLKNCTSMLRNAAQDVLVIYLMNRSRSRSISRNLDLLDLLYTLLLTLDLSWS